MHIMNGEPQPKPRLVPAGRTAPGTSPRASACSTVVRPAASKQHGKRPKSPTCVHVPRRFNAQRKSRCVRTCAVIGPHLTGSQWRTGLEREAAGGAAERIEDRPGHTFRKGRPVSFDYFPTTVMPAFEYLVFRRGINQSDLFRLARSGYRWARGSKQCPTAVRERGPSDGSSIAAGVTRPR